jgi:ferredoxin
MPTTIYYFTGTGNSLTVARQLAVELRETELVPIPKAMNSGEQTRAPQGAVGLVFPVYVMGLPKIVARFAEQVDLSDTEYIFCVCTLAESGMTGAFSELEKILDRKQKVVNAAFGILMPQNYVFGPEGPNTAGQQKLFREASLKIMEIAAVIRERRTLRDTETDWKVRILRFAHPIFVWLSSSEDRKFSVLDSCSGCTTCEKVCPVGNITIENKRPLWHHSCEMCFACVNFCPTKSIQMGEKTQQHGRYHHPDVMVRDMMEQHGRRPDLTTLKNRK